MINQNKNTNILEKNLFYKIVGCIYQITKKYGRGLKEKIYQKALTEEFKKAGLTYEKAKNIKIYSFLKVSRYEIGYLVNFGANKLENKRSVNTNNHKPFVSLLKNRSPRENSSLNKNQCLRENQCISENSSPISDNSFTLMELMILIALISLIATAFLILLNPKKQIEKSLDIKRKKELNKLKKVLEDWYNDKNCYPKPSEICYDTPQQITDNTYTCHLCGNESTSPNFSPYLPRLPCDPQHPSKKYLYQTNNIICPTYYRIYTRFSTTNEPAIKEVGCYPLCGPKNEPLNYNYAVTSPNTKPENNINNLYYCSSINNCSLINQDRLPNELKVCQPLYTDPNCGESGCLEVSNCYYTPYNP